MKKRNKLLSLLLASSIIVVAGNAGDADSLISKRIENVASANQVSNDQVIRNLYENFTSSSSLKHKSNIVFTNAATNETLSLSSDSSLVNTSGDYSTVLNFQVPQSVSSGVGNINNLEIISKDSNYYLNVGSFLNSNKELLQDSGAPEEISLASALLGDKWVKFSSADLAASEALEIEKLVEFASTQIVSNDTFIKLFENPSDKIKVEDVNGEYHVTFQGNADDLTRVLANTNVQTFLKGNTLADSSTSFTSKFTLDKSTMTVKSHQADLKNAEGTIQIKSDFSDINQANVDLSKGAESAIDLATLLQFAK